ASSNPPTVEFDDLSSVRSDRGATDPAAAEALAELAELNTGDAAPPARTAARPPAAASAIPAFLGVAGDDDDATPLAPPTVVFDLPEAASTEEPAAEPAAVAAEPAMPVDAPPRQSSAFDAYAPPHPAPDTRGAQN